MDENKRKLSKKIVTEAYGKMADAGLTDEEIAACFDAAAEATRMIQPTVVLMKVLEALS